MNSPIQSYAVVVAPDRQRRRLVTKMLEEAGYAVETTDSVDGALAVLTVIRPAVLVIDEELEDKNRLQLAVEFSPGPITTVPISKLAAALATS